MADGVVKFFSADKGFGFIAPDGGGADVFVHASALRRNHLDNLQQGDEVSFEVGRDLRSGRPAVTRLAVTARASDDQAPVRAKASARKRRSIGPSAGVVKWFDPARGYGFILPSDLNEDVFVHVMEVERSGVGDLVGGQSLTFDLEQDIETGRFAASNLRRRSTSSQACA